MRTSESSLALLSQGDIVRRWLALWNDRWARFHFPGGHREPDESPRDCLLRELREELGPAVAEACTVPTRSLLQLEFEAWSEATRQQTQYRMDLFRVEIDGAGLAALRSNAQARWLSESEIHVAQTIDGRAISANMSRALKELERHAVPSPAAGGSGLLSRWDDLVASRAPQNDYPDVFDFLQREEGTSLREVAEVVLQDFTERRRQKQARPMHDYLSRIRAFDCDPTLKAELVAFEYRVLQDARQAPDIDSYVMQFPDVQGLLRKQIQSEPDAEERSRTIAVPSRVSGKPGSPSRPSAAPDDAAADEGLPLRLGRYRTQRILGTGTFGTVFEAVDDDLQRTVAVKLARQAGTAESREAFLAEARHVAALHHPHIVPVYDFGVLADGRCYLVQRYIQGESLAARIRRDRPRAEEAARLIATVAEALHLAHCAQIVHRDVKPANILLDQQGEPHLVDFGLAVNEHQQRSQMATVAGTPMCMSPEQVRGELRFLDGRSDIWSLGVILYELLTGRRPFQGSDLRELMEDVLQRDPKPLRVIEPAVPQALERICLKCLQKSKSDRFATALDLAGELRQACRTASSPKTAPVAEGVGVIAAEWEDPGEEFPVLGCSLINRAEVSVVVVAVRVDVTAFRPLRGGVTSREVPVASTFDVTLPSGPGSVRSKLRRPVLIASQDAVTLNVRFLSTSDGAAVSPARQGGYRFRVTFETDAGWETTTDELTLGRLPATG